MTESKPHTKPSNHYKHGLSSRLRSRCANYPDVVEAYVPSAEGTTEILRLQRQAYRRIHEYERKARSRINQAIRTIDYLVIEERRRITASKAGRPN